MKVIPELRQIIMRAGRKQDKSQSWPRSAEALITCSAVKNTGTLDLPAATGSAWSFRMEAQRKHCPWKTVSWANEWPPQGRGSSTICSIEGVTSRKRSEVLWILIVTIVQSRETEASWKLQETASQAILLHVAEEKEKQMRVIHDVW